MATVTHGSLTFDPATLAADLISIQADADFKPLADAVIFDANRRTMRADALARAQTAVEDFIQAGGSVDTVKQAASNLVGMAQQMTSAGSAT